MPYLSLKKKCVTGTWILFSFVADNCQVISQKCLVKPILLSQSFCHDSRCRSYKWQSDIICYVAWITQKIPRKISVFLSLCLIFFFLFLLWCIFNDRFVLWGYASSVWMQLCWYYCWYYYALCKGETCVCVLGLAD